MVFCCARDSVNHSRTGARQGQKDLGMDEGTASGGEVFIVDDDASVREALAVVFGIEGLLATGFADGSAFLQAAHARVPRCILLDVHMPGRSGIDILKELNAQHYGAPIFMISAAGDIPMAVEAIKNGAFDFIEKPFDLDAVVARVRNAIETWARHRGHRSAVHRREFPRHDLLTPREREVLAEIAAGASNKEAGRRLGISPRTIEVHRARVMEKLRARNAADLVRIVLTEGV
jgi:FixJ family two-component response regulator